MVLDEFRLDGKVAIVTGAGRGLGKAMALALAEAGADVAVTARTVAQIEETAAEIRKLGRRSVAIACDVSQRPQVDRMVDRVVAELGRVDVLVNNAGIGSPDKWLLDTTDDDWLTVINTDLNGVFYCTRAVGRYLVPQRSGKIINIASGAGMFGAPRLSAYHAAKAGVILFTKCLALEWNRFNINVNAIAPGFFATELLGGLEENKEALQAFLKQIPLRRLGQPREIGPLAVYLASSASDYVTGETVVIDGGVIAY